MIETVEKRPYPPFDRLRASDLEHVCMSARGEPVEPGTAHQSASAGSVAALVPVKGLAAAKSRLRLVLSDGQRRALALAMLEDVLRLLSDVGGIGMRAVVSPDPEVLAFAAGLGAQAIAEPPSVRGLNPALTFASALLSQQGASGLLVLPSDLPLATASDIEAILAAAEDKAVVVCPSRSGGTNALALRPPGVIPFRFGRRSAAAHQREAIARGLPVRLLPLPALALDIDRPQDLAALLAQPKGTKSREVLAALAFEPITAA